MAVNYRQMYAMKHQRENKIKEICPNITNRSGIYAFYRIDENGIKRSYVGQAKHLCERCASHLAEYDHIALSLKRHGFYSKENPYGWKLAFRECPESELDTKEIETIKAFADKGHQLYNVSLGGQGANHASGTMSAVKPGKGYRDGLKQGYKNASRDVSTLFDKHLDYKPKSEVPTHHQLRAMEKFNEFLEFHKGQNGDNEEVQ